MYSHRKIIQLLVIIGMVSFGCNSDNNDHKKSSKQINLTDRSGRKQGPWEFYENNTLVAKGKYVDGEPDGLWTYWYKNGHMKEEGRYKNGVKNGMWVEWYQDGDILWKGEWNNGVRHIENKGARANVTILGHNDINDVLSMDSSYQLKIRIPNIPPSNLFVEVSRGEITRKGNSDIFILKPLSDSTITMAIGYMPDLNFRDFRNLVSEINLKLK